MGSRKTGGFLAGVKEKEGKDKNTKREREITVKLPAETNRKIGQD